MLANFNCLEMLHTRETSALRCCATKKHRVRDTGDGILAFGTMHIPIQFVRNFRIISLDYVSPGWVRADCRPLDWNRLGHLGG